MPKRAVSRQRAGQRSRRPRQRTQEKPRTVITVPTPIQPEESLWEIELLDMDEQEFLALWHRRDDRLGFHPQQRSIFDKTKVVARIVNEIKVKPPRALEEEEE